MLARCKAECSRWLRSVFGRFTRRVVDSVVSGLRAGLFPDQPQVGVRPAEVTAPRTVIWWWTTKWRTVDEIRFVEIEVPTFQIDRVLVAVGIVDSRSNAQRLIKGNGISWRRDDNEMEWTKVTDWKTEIPTGWPWVLRVGSGHWRTVQIEVLGFDGKPVTKPKSFPSLAVVMRPGEGQTIEVWSELWK